MWQSVVTSVLIYSRQFFINILLPLNRWSDRLIRHLQYSIYKNKSSYITWFCFENGFSTFFPLDHIVNTFITLRSVGCPNLHAVYWLLENVHPKKLETLYFLGGPQLILRNTCSGPIKCSRLEFLGWTENLFSSMLKENCLY